MRKNAPQLSSNPTQPLRLLADDPVLVGRQLLDGGASPTVGDDDVTIWDVNVLGRPANRGQSWGRIHFEPLTGSWLITAKTLVVLSLSPNHALFVESGTRVRHRAQSPSTARKFVKGVLVLKRCATELRMPSDLSRWTLSHFNRAYRHVATASNDYEHDLLIDTVRRLHQYRHLFEAVTYKGRPAAAAARARRAKPGGVLATQPVEPVTWRATLHAAITYVCTFSKDILAARAEQRRLSSLSTRKSPPPDVVDRYLSRPGLLVPVKTAPADPDTIDTVVNWRMLSLRLSDGSSEQVFTGNKPQMRLRRSLVIAKVRLGEWTTASLHQPAERLSGRAEPWIESLDGARLSREEAMLRSACYIVIAALTMMRDSEVQSLRKGCLTSDHGIPAITGMQVKGHTHRPERKWWINDAVADAIRVLETLNDDTDYLFTSTRRTREERTATIGFAAGVAIVAFVRHVNRNSERTGLPTIPTEQVTPHMLRRTMAMLAAQEPHGEIAAGIQLGHCFRRAMAGAITGGYTAEHKRWETEFLSQEAARAAQELAADITAEGVQQLRGPGAQRVEAAIGPVVADAGTSRRLLLHFPDLQVGAFNLCLGDRAVARCIDSASEAPQQLLLEQCQPDKCTNSVVLVKQQEGWREDLKTINGYLRQRRLSPELREQLTAKKRVIERALQDTEGRLNDKDKPQRVGRSRREHHHRDEAPP